MSKIIIELSDDDVLTSNEVKFIEKYHGKLLKECQAEDCIECDYTAKYIEEFANNEYVSEHEAETIYTIAEGIRHIPSVYPKSDKPSLRELLPIMRDVTPEERETMNKAIRDMCYDTGVTLQGLMNHETYIPKSVLEDIKTEIESINDWAIRYVPTEDKDKRAQIVAKVKKHIISIVDKHISGKDDNG